MERERGEGREEKRNSKREKRSNVVYEIVV